MKTHGAPDIVEFAHRLFGRTDLIPTPPQSQWMVQEGSLKLSARIPTDWKLLTFKDGWAK